MSKLTLADLLASTRADEPSAEQLAGLERKLGHLFTVPPGGGDGGGTGTSGDGGAGSMTGGAKGAVVGTAKKAATVKWLAAVLGAAATVAVIHHVATRADHPAAVQAPVTAPPPTPVPPPTPTPVPPPTPTPTPTPPPAPEAAPPKVPAPRPADPPRPTHRGSGALVNTLAAESKLLEQARAALASKNAGAALQICERHARLYTRGQLVEERERIAIEALVALGRRDAARIRAKRFDRDFPNSVQSERIHALVGDS